MFKLGQKLFRTFAVVATIAATPVDAQQVLRQLDSVVVHEREGAFLEKIGSVVVGPLGQLFVPVACRSSLLAATICQRQRIHAINSSLETRHVSDR